MHHLRRATAALISTVAIAAVIAPTPAVAAPTAGNADVTYGVDGSVELPDDLRPTEVVAAPDGSGRSFVLGTTLDSSAIRVVAVSRDGVVDATFGDGGVASFVGDHGNHPQGIAVDGDGRLLVATQDHAGPRWAPSAGIVRLSPTGVVDESYAAGVVTGYAARIESLADGSALVAGTVGLAGYQGFRAVLVKLDPTGAVDTSFGYGGYVNLPGTPTGLAVQPDGKLVVSTNPGMYDTSNTLVLRVDAGGRADRSFGFGGVRYLETHQTGTLLGTDAVAVDRQGRILVAGDRTMRLAPNGALDLTFTVNALPYALNRVDGIFADGRILVGGTAELLLGPDGIWSRSFGRCGAVVGAVDAAIVGDRVVSVLGRTDDVSEPVLPTVTALTTRSTVASRALPAGPGVTYATAAGGVVLSGGACYAGNLADHRLNQPVVGIATTPTGLGYWMVARDGGIFSFGDARFLGSTGALRLNAPIVGMASTPSGRGYWLVASDGGIFTFGDAAFLGSTGAIRLNRPIVGMASTPSGRGYWLVASDGGIFTFGDASFAGSTGGFPLSRLIVGMASTASGRGYWLVSRDNRVFPFGDARHFGELSASDGDDAIAIHRSGQCYVLAKASGLSYAYGPDAVGSLVESGRQPGLAVSSAYVAGR